jgi:acetyl/propionyl-CoA carboxylase alpha subunit
MRGDVRLAAVAVALAEQATNREATGVLAGIPSGWRNNPAVDQVLDLVLDEEPVHVTYRLGRGGHLTVDGTPVPVSVVAAGPDAVVLDDDGIRRTFRVGRAGDRRVVDADDGHVTFGVLPRHPEPGSAALAGSLVAPMPGHVLRVLVAAGDAVTAGQPLVVVEAMKMEHQVLAPAEGTVAAVHVAAGEQVDTGQVLLQMEETPATEEPA